MHLSYRLILHGQEGQAEQAQVKETYLNVTSLVCHSTSTGHLFLPDQDQAIVELQQAVATLLGICFIWLRLGTFSLQIMIKPFWSPSKPLPDCLELASYGFVWAPFPSRSGSSHFGAPASRCYTACNLFNMASFGQGKLKCL